MQTLPAGKISFLALFPAIMLPMFLAIVDQTIVATALPAIAKDLGNVERLSWIMVSYLIAVTISAPVFGVLGDNFGRRRLLLIALLIIAVSSTLCALAQSANMLIAARLLQGLGGGGLMTLSHALIGETVPPRERGRYQGYLAGIAVTASTFGPVIGGVMAEHAGWQSVFLINLPIAALAGFLVWRLPSHKPAAGHFRFDYAGLALFALMVSIALIGMEQLQDPTTLSVPLLAVLACAVAILLPTLIWRENRAATPLLSLSLLGRPDIWRADALAACHGATMVSLITFVPIFLCVTYRISAAEAGLLMLPMTAGIGLGSMATGRAVSRTGRTAIFPSVGMIIIAVSMVHFAWRSPQLSLNAVSILLGVTALAMGTVMGVVQITVQSAAGPRMLGLAAASVQLCRSLGAAFGTALVGTVLFMTLNLASPDTAHLMGGILRQNPEALAAVTPELQRQIAFAFQMGFGTVACFALIGCLLAWTLPLRRV